MDLDRRLNVLVMHEDPIIAAGVTAVLGEQAGLSVKHQPAEAGAATAAARNVEVVVTDYRSAMTRPCRKRRRRLPSADDGRAAHRRIRLHHLRHAGIPQGPGCTGHSGRPGEIRDHRHDHVARRAPLPFQFSTGGSLSELALSHKLVVNDTNGYLAAGLAGLGIIQAPSYAVDRAIKDGRLVALLEDWQTPSAPVNVIYAPNRYLSAKVRVFIDWTVALFEGHENLRRI
jgi:DNA-binding transcriptional LysR family regulator